MCDERGRDDLKVHRFPAKYRYADVNRMLDMLKELPLKAGVVVVKPAPGERRATNEQIAYVLRLQAEMSDPVGVEDDITRAEASDLIDSLKARREN
jgi:hypothetical protein